MKTTYTILAALIFPILLLAQSFNGHIKYQLSGDNLTLNSIDYYRSNDKERIEPTIPGETKINKLYFLVDGGSTYMVMPGLKYFFNYGANNAEAVLLGKKLLFGKNASKAVNTGETKTIQGVAAEKWTLTKGDYSVVIWAAKNLGKADALAHAIQKDKMPMPEWFYDILINELFPMSVTVEYKDGAKDNLEIAEFNNSGVDESLLVVPSNYKEFKTH